MHIYDSLNELQKSGEIKCFHENLAWHVETTCHLGEAEIEQVATSISDKMAMLERERATKVNKKQKKNKKCKY